MTKQEKVNFRLENYIQIIEDRLDILNRELAEIKRWVDYSKEELKKVCDEMVGEDTVQAISVKDIEERITALSYMANEKKYPQTARSSFQIEANNLITLLKDFGYE